MSYSIYSSINDIKTWREQAIHKTHVKARAEKWDSNRLDARLNDVHRAYQEKISDLLGDYGNTTGR